MNKQQAINYLVEKLAKWPSKGAEHKLMVRGWHWSLLNREMALVKDQTEIITRDEWLSPDRPLANNQAEQVKKKCYVAGPMTGIDNFNREAFYKQTRKLTDAGYTVLNPAILPDGLTEHDYMRIGLTMLQVCDVICMLPNWMDSKGASVEYGLAIKLGIEVIYV